MLRVRTAADGYRPDHWANAHPEARRPAQTPRQGRARDHAPRWWPRRQPSAPQSAQHEPSVLARRQAQHVAVHPGAGGRSAGAEPGGAGSAGGAGDAGRPRHHLLRQAVKLTADEESQSAGWLDVEDAAHERPDEAACGAWCTCEQCEEKLGRGGAAARAWVVAMRRRVRTETQGAGSPKQDGGAIFGGVDLRCRPATGPISGDETLLPLAVSNEDF